MTLGGTERRRGAVFRNAAAAAAIFALTTAASFGKEAH